MDKVKNILFVLIFLTIVTHAFSFENEYPRFTFDWYNTEIKVIGIGDIIPQDSGNFIEWQYDALRKAQTNLFKNFIVSLSALRIDAYNYAQDILIRESEKNEWTYDYVKDVRKKIVQYTEQSVVMKTDYPLFGQNGLAKLLVTAGMDRGTFPKYDEYVYSTPFTGLVIDGRGLKRVPALCPRIYNEDHQSIYSVDQMNRESFETWGTVQYSDDPFYRAFEERVGNNPYKIVALENEKLIPTDLTISNENAMVLLQNETTRKNLMEGRVIIILDSVSQDEF